MHGIGGDIIIGLLLAVLVVFLAAMIWAGLMIPAIEPVEPRYRAKHRR